MAKRERDGWAIHTNTKKTFCVHNGEGSYAWVREDEGEVEISTRGAHLPPARAIQFAAKVQEIAARAANKAAKEAKRC